MPAGASNGGPEATRDDDLQHQMRVFDGLPLPIRRWLTQATFDYDARQAQDFMNKCIGMPIDLVIQALDDYDLQRRITEHERVYRCLAPAEQNIA
ncbi:DUF6525 family protein [Mycobacterium sp.]|uniref:DUF6525 family protein n=1 Tax=Mycobacterium sp. TaxID=1785 RepID=UPI002BC8CF2D|nr:DUF6525 family protein [Mycobacterium sp.]HTQ17495.1 DUF6525 family protein [Mycobacterium sp.]